MITVAIADDSYLVREALQQIIGRSEHLTLAAVCADGDELREVIAREPPDAVVTDLRMPPSGDGEGLAVARELREAHPEIAVILLSQFAEPRIALELLEDGAQRRGYLLKDRVADAGGLPAAIEAVVAGGTLMDPGMVGSLIGAAARSNHSPLGELSGREREVLALMAEGMSNAAIAERLVVTQRAVEKHVNAIFRKLGLRDEHLVSRRVKAVLLHLSG
ncbi:response regulator transcription factor [Solirubrobacter ginsenosidimutans]|uniref:Response regulator transcription factor n=1 Tax=Solirubrobacter ginsenosidimutans TaxID=490573 RepID=A0A9X3MPJ6_9ACTN|nr:response regulator transcription factor [Solirubrobacter ginsenosidimutans]MDA0160059.1 response regulator transcription factor [Solirubrobacter ginsenosidimutans]